MRKLLFGAVGAVALCVASVPATAQAYVGADPWGAGVRVGPFGFGIGPSHDPYWRGGYRDGYYRDGHYAYGADCPLVRERIVMPNGRVIFRTRRACY